MRAFVFTTISTAPTVQAFVGNPDPRIYEGASLTEVPKVAPFIVIRMGASSPRLRGRGKPGERILPMQKYFQIWGHDRSGDYQLIDAMLLAVRRVLEDQETEAIEWIEQSKDLKDPDLNTITRYDRYIITTSR